MGTLVSRIADLAAAVGVAMKNRVRVDTAAQGLTGAQQANARTNIGALGSTALASTLGAALVGLAQGGVLQNAVLNITPQMFGALGDGVTDDGNALVAACNAVIAAGSIGCLYLGSAQYRTTKPILTKCTTPIAIRGDGRARAWIIMDKALVGDLMSFSNCWYGAESVVTNTGAAQGGNPNLGYSWPNLAGRRSGVRLEGFSVVADRSTANTQNGIIFYDRNDAVRFRDVDVQFVRGIGVCLAGLPSNPATNTACVIRESWVQGVSVRWCGDLATGRPSVVFNSNSKTVAQAGSQAAISDDANNYNNIDLLIAFSEGMSFQSNCHNLNAPSSANNRVKLILDSQRGAAATPTHAAGGYINSGYCSIANGVLTIAAGATFTLNSGVGTGDLAVGTFVYNVSVPAGTYISAILSGPGSNGAGTYQLANANIDLSAFSVASGTLASCRFATPMLELGGGHDSEIFDLTLYGSYTSGSSSTAVILNQNPLNPNGAKMQRCHATIAMGSSDLGLLFTSVSSLTARLLAHTPTVPITVGLISQSVTIDVGNVTTGNEMQINGSMQNLHVYPGGQKIVSGSTIGGVMTANKWPNCEMYLNNAGTLTRYVSLPTSPSYNACTWVQT